MKKTTKYGVPSLEKDFPNEETCLNFLFKNLHSEKCSCGGTYRLISGRRQFQCSKCRFQIAPMAWTIFEKSSTPLTLWFKAILLFSNAKSGISAKTLQANLEVTYKCAWRILSEIKKALAQDDKPLEGVIETDVGYFGGRKYAGKNNEKLSEAMKAKATVIAAVQRNGKMRAKIVPNASADVLEKFVKGSVEVGSVLLTDKAKGFNRLDKHYRHFSVHHKKGEYVRYKAHVNTIETFFSHLKRSIKGTFKSVSKKHLQSYLDAF
ncbi:MAG: IS1595 family transposase, partial [Patescibacteria group bacterium]|nr:IS1595 family transposase [Patescibacteria group bacterium]